MNPLAALWLCWLITAFSPIISGFAVTVVHPIVLVLLGAILATLYFTPYLTKNKLWGRLFDKKTLLPFFIMGTFGTTLSFSILIYALNYTTPGNVAILNQTEIIYSLILTSILLKERPAKKQILGSVLVLIGVVTILLKEKFTPRITGDLIVVCTIWLFQVAHITAKKLPKDLPHNLIAAARNIFAIPSAIIICLILLPMGKLYLKPGFQFFAVLTATGIFKYGLAMTLWYIALKKIDVSKMTVILLSYPAASFILSILFGFETPRMYQIIGLVLTFAGAFLVSNVVKQQQKEAQ
ncbi:drug/metabolite transporter (DMT)-like permease [Elusimicrobium posterum]|uniref:DMT family transporter n=1 Tax=Elusimicrobium posterum TaxID=3116653 RepID=UPI003C757F00